MDAAASGAAGSKEPAAVGAAPTGSDEKTKSVTVEDVVDDVPDPDEDDLDDLDGK
jgi:hypothetical protein